jgi:hypothetical protein
MNREKESQPPVLTSAAENSSWKKILPIWTCKDWLANRNAVAIPSILPLASHKDAGWPKQTLVPWPAFYRFEIACLHQMIDQFRPCSYFGMYNVYNADAQRALFLCSPFELEVSCAMSFLISGRRLLFAQDRDLLWQKWRGPGDLLLFGQNQLNFGKKSLLYSTFTYLWTLNKYPNALCVSCAWCVAFGSRMGSAVSVHHSFGRFSVGLHLYRNLPKNSPTVVWIKVGELFLSWNQWWRWLEKCLNKFRPSWPLFADIAPVFVDLHARRLRHSGNDQLVKNVKRAITNQLRNIIFTSYLPSKCTPQNRIKNSRDTKFSPNSPRLGY